MKHIEPPFQQWVDDIWMSDYLVPGVGMTPGLRNDIECAVAYTVPGHPLYGSPSADIWRDVDEEYLFPTLAIYHSKYI